ncbi:hypothetical protein ACLB2K_046421 [Fragaria x ananassa]
MSVVIEELGAKADKLYHGDAICQEKSKFLPMMDVIRCNVATSKRLACLAQAEEEQHPQLHKFEKVGEAEQLCN